MMTRDEAAVRIDPDAECSEAPDPTRRRRRQDWRFEAITAPEDTAAHLAEIEPGGEVVAALDLLDPRQLSHAGRVNGLVAIDRQIAWLQGLQQTYLATMAADPAVPDPVPPSSAADPDPRTAAAAAAMAKNWVREDVACALRISAPVAREPLEFAQQLCTDRPATLVELQRGRISLWHAKHLTESLTVMAPSLAASIETAVLAAASDQTFSEFRRALRRAILVADPGKAETDHARAVEDRCVRKTALENGITGLWAPLSADAAELAYAGITARARAIATDNALAGIVDERTPDQRRADALVELCSAPLDTGALNFVYRATATPNRPNATATPNRPNATATPNGPNATATPDGPNATATPDGPDRHPHVAPLSPAAPEATTLLRRQSGTVRPPKPLVNVTVALSTLLGLDDNPGELDGHGPIPASLARRIASDPTGTWRRIITDPVGRLLDYGRTRYRPPRDLADHIIVRDGVCTFPGCRRSAVRCDLDHIIDWHHGGQTNPENLAALCSRHHHAKHEAGWQPNRDASTGTTHWKSPTGHSYHSTPPLLPTPGPLSVRREIPPQRSSIPLDRAAS